MRTVWTEVQVDIDMDDFDDDDLLEELELRGLNTNRGRIYELYDELRNPGSNQQKLLADFFWETIGRTY